MIKDIEKIQIIIDTIGFDNTIKLCKVFAGEQVYIPKSISISIMHDEIKKEFAAGKTYRALAIKYNLTTRQIRIITHPKNSNDELNQLLLF